MKIDQGQNPLAEKLLYLAVVFLPFQQALSLNIGFPLKISEVLGVASVFLLIMEPHRSPHPFYGRGKLILLGVGVAISTLVSLLVDLPVQAAPGYANGFLRDILQYAGYGFLVLVVGWYMASRLGPEVIGKGMGVALRLAASYCVVQLGLWILGTSTALQVVNGTFQGGTAFGAVLPRNGPFLEGNYLGFFAGVGLLIALRRRDKIGVAAGIFCLLYSQSTIGILGVIAGLFLTMTLRPSGKATTALSFVGLVAALAVTFVPVVNGLVAHQLAKLGLVDVAESGGSVSFSLRARTFNTEAGLAMGIDNPLLGVGPGRFGLWQPFYADFTGLPPGYRAGIRPIVGNAYVQIFAEVGLLAALAFFLLIAGLLWRLWRQGHGMDLALAAFVAIGLNATPAWTGLPIWVAIAYLASVRMKPRVNSTGDLDAAHKDMKLSKY
ncbi:MULTISPECIES: O-antigen ligase family protein [unclassified Pseudarthrobacter]|uniref:O-antigen ligase family protein n=1 Tax=unclassified Pseudarthrobacter TaxID=2647000 RepID=UPI0030769286